MEATLLSVIGGLMVLNGWQAWRHERSMTDAVARLSLPPKLPKPKLPPPPVLVPLPERWGWQTMMDLAKTRRIDKLPTYPALDVRPPSAKMDACPSSHVRRSLTAMEPLPLRRRS